MRLHTKQIRTLAFLAVAAVPLNLAGPAAAQVHNERAEGRKGAVPFDLHRETVAGTLGNIHAIELIPGGYGIAGKVVAQAPYSAEATTEMVQTLADGNRIVRKNTAMIYRDSQGRTRREQQLGAIGPWATSNEAAKMIFIHDPVAGVHYILNPQNRTARKMTPPHMDTVASEAQPGTPIQRYRILHDSHEQVEEHHWVSRDITTDGVDVKIVEKHGDVSSRQVETESLGKRVIEGVEVEGARTVMTIPAGAIGNEQPIEVVSETWFSPELQTAILTKRKDPRFGETTHRLTNIQRVEPLPSLFEAPADFTIEDAPGLFGGLGRNRTEPER